MHDALGVGVVETLRDLDQVAELQGLGHGLGARDLVSQVLAGQVLLHQVGNGVLEAEVEHRAVARRRAVVANLVALVDGTLVLSADQRKQLAEVFAANWNPDWEQANYFTLGGRYYPPMPDAKVRPVLTDAQREVWDSLSKGTVRFGVNVNVPPWADAGDDDGPPPAPRDAVKKEAGKQ